ncbi:unnamed protein product [Brassica rapa subsp. trilocularis]
MTSLKLEILRMYNDDDDEGKDLSDLRNPDSESVSGHQSPISRGEEAHQSEEKTIFKCSILVPVPRGFRYTNKGGNQVHESKLYRI